MEENSQERQSQDRQKRSYANSPWINVYDWQVTRHTNSKTNEEFWDVKLAKGTFIEVGGERVDVPGYRFHTGYEPSTSFGKRGIHFPNGWEITLRRFENTAPAGEPPAFVETVRIEAVTAQQIADGLKDRSVRWREARELAGPKQTRDGVREGDAPGIGKASDAEPLKPCIHCEGTEPNLDCIYENDMSATLISMGFSSSFTPLGPDHGGQATMIFRDKESEAQVYVSTILFERNGVPIPDFDAHLGLALGVPFDSFVVTTAEVDLVISGRTICTVSFDVALVLTCALSGVFMPLIYLKLSRINMVLGV